MFLSGSAARLFGFSLHGRRVPSLKEISRPPYPLTWIYLDRVVVTENVLPPVGAEVALKNGVLKDGLRAEWFDPRTGRRRPAKAFAANRYRTPDSEDWVLVLRPNGE